MNITNDIRYIGVNDRKVDLFEGQYPVPNGISYNSYAILDEKINLYLARDLDFGETDPDDDEFIDVVQIPLAEMVDAVMEGEILDGKTQLAVLKVNELLRREKAEKETPNP